MEPFKPPILNCSSESVLTCKNRTSWAFHIPHVGLLKILKSLCFEPTKACNFGFYIKYFSDCKHGIPEPSLKTEQRGAPASALTQRLHYKGWNLWQLEHVLGWWSTNSDNSDPAAAVRKGRQSGDLSKEAGSYTDNCPTICHRLI